MIVAYVYITISPRSVYEASLSFLRDKRHSREHCQGPESPLLFSYIHTYPSAYAHCESPRVTVVLDVRGLTNTVTEEEMSRTPSCLGISTCYHLQELYDHLQLA